MPPIQLYDLEKDIGETTNLRGQHPEIVTRLTRLMEKAITDGRTTPGKPRKNTTPVQIWRK